MSPCKLHCDASGQAAKGRAQNIFGCLREWPKTVSDFAL
jgi:hypothetical protein